MIRTHALNLATPKASDFVRKGTLVPPPKKALGSLPLKISLTLHNGTGGGLALNAADKLLILKDLQFILKAGAGDKQQFNIFGDMMRYINRLVSGCELTGFNDAVTGLGQTVGAGADAVCTFWLPIPFENWKFGDKDRKRFAVGASQAQTLTLQVTRGNDPTFSTALVIKAGSAISIDVDPEFVDVAADRFAPILEVREVPTTDFKVQFDDGLCFHVAEETAALASTSLQKIKVRIDGETIHDDISPIDAYTTSKRALASTSGQDVSDTFSPVYDVPPDRTYEELKAGAVYVENPGHDLASMTMLWIGYPALSAEEKQADLEYVANKVRMETVKAVPVSKSQRRHLPDSLSAYEPWLVVGEDDVEFSMFSGLGCSFRGRAQPFIVDHEAQAVAAVVSKAKDTGNAQLARAAIHSVAQSIPGAAAGSKGHKGANTPILSSIQNKFGTGH